MPEPKNAEEYIHRFHENSKVEGYGMDTAMSVACPFCAAPEFMMYRILDVHEEMTKEHTCKECGRSSKAVFTTDRPGTISFEMVQTGGPDQPEWLVPHMRRV